jgi:GTP cyclohydrolase I
MSIVESPGSLPERSAPVRHHSLPVVLSRAEVDLPAAEHAVTDLPFHGSAHIGYLPGERMLGLSKLVRVVDLFARASQVRERPTQQVSDALQEHLAPKRVGVVIETEQL